MDNLPPEIPEPPQPQGQSSRLRFIGARLQGPQDIFAARRYSAFVRWARVALPMLAAVIAVVVLSWNILGQRDIDAVRDAAKIPKGSGKNELLNARYESRDSKNQPYTITAARASQAEGDDNIVVLEKPTADLLMEDGHWIAARAAEGAFMQSEQNLKLSGDVQFFHDDGYQLGSAYMIIDVKGSTAQTDAPVSSFGPKMKLEANGLRANAETGHLVFIGPTKLVLEDGAKGLGDLAPAAPQN